MTLPIEFEIYETVGNLLQNKVVDIKTDRKNSRFVFPTFTTNNSQLPQYTIKLGESTTEEDSAGDYLQDETLENGDYKVYYYKKITFPIHIYAVTSKEGNINVTELNNNFFLDGKKLNIYWQNLAKQCIYRNIDILKSKFTDFKIQNVSTTFDNNEYSWASDITCQVIAKDKWVKEYHKGELIKEYSLSQNIIGGN